MHINRFFEKRGHAPINGYSYAVAAKTDRVAGPVHLSKNFLYHDILYGYHDDEVIGYGILCYQSDFRIYDKQFQK